VGETVRWAAVLLTGGTGSRMGGADKALLAHGDRSLLDRALDAVALASQVVVVGPRVPTERDATFVREAPVGSGPLAALSAGVAALPDELELVVVLAVDMPHVTAATVTRLVAAVGETSGAWLVDGEGRRQLAGVVRPAIVPPAAEAAGRPMRVVMAHPDTVDVPATQEEAEDVDTWEDATRLGIRSDTSRRTCRTGQPREDLGP
jgi:molybdenum cofactor guanylyltransferase